MCGRVPLWSNFDNMISRNQPRLSEHCLLECEQWRNERKQLKEALDRIHVPMELSVILGNVEKKPTAKQQAILTITGNFLLAIDGIRRL